jgi:inner membrane protein
MAADLRNSASSGFALRNLTALGEPEARAIAQLSLTPYNTVNEADLGTMATLYSHAVVGWGLARLYTARPMPWAYWGLAVALPIIPDLDVFSTAAYGSPLGHRGITHSLLFAFLLGAVAASATFRPFRTSWWSVASLFFLILASHGLLDAMTYGGEGIPFFWPLAGRYGNWGVIPVSDIAFELPDPRQSRAVRGELLWVWLPTIVVVGLTMLGRHLGGKYSRRQSAR